MEEKIEFIKEVFDRLSKNKIKYCILRKTTEIISGTAHDIDMVVDISKFENVIEILDIVANELNWSIFLKTTKDKGNLIALHYYLVKDNEIYIVHFDIFKTYSWEGISLIDNNILLKNSICNNGIYSCSYEIEAITKLFSNLLYHGKVKEEYKDDINTLFRSYNTTILMIMEFFLDRELCELVNQFVIKEKWDDLEKLSEILRRDICNKYYKTRFSKYINKIALLIFKLKRYFDRQGVMVVFLGSDGSGKSTIIENIPNIIGNTFDESQIKYYHWRPKFIKSPKENINLNNDTTQPHMKEPYSKLVSLVKFMYFNLDYILGYWFSAKIHLGKNELVIFDRYYYDYLIDKYRYRLNLSDKTIKKFMYLIPKPDITFILVGNAEVLYERKKELSIDEIKVQNTRLKINASAFQNSKIIDVNQDINCVLFDVCESILRKMKGRYI